MLRNIDLFWTRHLIQLLNSTRFIKLFIYTTKTVLIRCACGVIGQRISLLSLGLWVRIPPGIYLCGVIGQRISLLSLRLRVRIPPGIFFAHLSRHPSLYFSSFHLTIPRPRGKNNTKYNTISQYRVVKLIVYIIIIPRPRGKINNVYYII